MTFIRQQGPRVVVRNGVLVSLEMPDDERTGVNVLSRGNAEAAV